MKCLKHHTKLLNALSIGNKKFCMNVTLILLMSADRNTNKKV